MKGIVLAGGNGTRLLPLTKVTNKSLLPIYDRPMVWWPIKTLVDSGISEIMLVCGGNAAGEFLRILGNGEDFGLDRLNYAYQAKPDGIAGALMLAREFAGEDTIAVVLADNIFENNIKKSVQYFDDTHIKRKEAGWRGGGLAGSHGMIFTTKVANPSFYGVAETDDSGSILSIEEKPLNPKSNNIVVGLYMYTPLVWDYIYNLTPSKRGELEITDLNNMFLKDGFLEAQEIMGRWADAGESLDGYLECCNMASQFGKQ